MIYHQRSTDADERMKQLLTDADKLLALCGSDYNDSTEYELFVRCLSEQTIVENVGANGSIVTEYQYEQNNHSDSQFIQEHLERMDKQEERTVIVTDGAYSGTEHTQLAADKNIDLITTSLTGKPAPDILADFEFNEEGTKVLRCPAGHAPKSCSYMKQSNQCAVSFLHEQRGIQKLCETS